MTCDIFQDADEIETKVGRPKSLMPEWDGVYTAISPDHYTRHPSGIECIQITRHENFCIGNAMKYLWRRNEKGKPIEDLRKAIRYIEFEIERLEAAK